MMTMDEQTTTGRIERLRSALQGLAVMPGDANFRAATAAWDLGTRHDPAVAVVPKSANDIATAVQFARRHQLPVAVQNTGHGQLFCCNGGLLINTSQMRRVEVDAERCIARVQAGARWKDVMTAAQPFGLAGLCGSSPEVGVVGYTLGGGTGWLARRYGYACDSVVLVELVTGEGRQIRASESENPDLFWALRGGSGGFGAVTALEFQLYPVSTVYGGTMFFPIERALEIFNLYAGWTADLPDSLTSAISILHLPPAPFVPEPLRGQSVVAVQVCHLGTDADAAGHLAPLRESRPMLDTVRRMPYCDIGTIANDPVQPMECVVGTQNLAAMPAGLIQSTVDAAADRLRTSLATICFRHIEGAYSKLAEHASAASRTAARYAMIATGAVMAPEMRPKIAADTDALVRIAEPYREGAPLFNFVGSHERYRAESFELFSTKKYGRLAQVKAHYDPDNVFRFCAPVTPAATG